MNTPQSPTARPGRRDSFAPLASVRGRIAAAFLLFVVVLAALVTTSVWTIQAHRATLEEMEERARVTSLLEEAKVNAIYAGAAIEQYIMTGDADELERVRSRSPAAMDNLMAAVELANSIGGPEERERMNQLLEAGLAGAAAANQVVFIRQNGGAEAGAAAMADALPQLTAFWEDLEEISAAEREQVASLRTEADRMGDIALWSIVVAGAIGAAASLPAAFFVARSILNPLSRLEATAKSVAAGDLDARAEGGGPRELAHLARTMNHTIAALQEREQDLVASNEELRERNRQLVEARAQAATDALTSLSNHRSFHEAIRREVSAADLNGGSVGVIMLDIDGFKAVNDTLGHLAGDEILRECSAAFCRVAPRECVYRYGGDEFSVLLPGATEADAVDIAEQLRQVIAGRDDRGIRRVTVSLGVAAYPETAGSAEELIYQADAAMYWAKSAGKDRIGRWDSVSRGEGAPTPHPAGRHR